MNIGKQIKEEGIESLGRYYGNYRGFVHSNEDPEFLGRLRVIVPSITGNSPIQEWAWCKGIYAGNGVGFFAVPSPKDGVWVSFENGDPDHPIWEYGWWGSKQVPTAADNNNGKPTNLVLQSTSGHRIELDNKEGEEEIRITDKTGNVQKFTNKGMFMHEQGGLNIELSNGKITLHKGGILEPALLGDKTEDVLKTFQQVSVGLLAFATASKASVTDPTLVLSATALETLLQPLVQQLGAQMALIKSKVVSLE